MPGNTRARRPARGHRPSPDRRARGRAAPLRRDQREGRARVGGAQPTLEERIAAAIAERERAAGAPAPGAEDGGGRPAHRRHRPRFQQSADVISGSLDMLAPAGDADEQARRYRRRDRPGGRARRRSDRPAARLRPPPAAAARGIDLNALIGDMTDLLRRTLGERIEVETELADGLWPVEADRAARIGDAQPRGQRPRRHARRRPADDRAPQRPLDAAAPTARRGAGDYVAVASPTPAPACDRGRSAARLRAVLHHQGRRQGHRPRPQPGLRLRQAVGRRRRHRQRGRRGHDVTICLPRAVGQSAAGAGGPGRAIGVVPSKRILVCGPQGRARLHESLLADSAARRSSRPMPSRRSRCSAGTCRSTSCFPTSCWAVRSTA